jgi:hypothetical protein
LLGQLVKVWGILFPSESRRLFMLGAFLERAAGQGCACGFGALLCGSDNRAKACK